MILTRELARDDRNLDDLLRRTQVEINEVYVHRARIRHIEKHRDADGRLPEHWQDQLQKIESFSRRLPELKRREQQLSQRLNENAQRY